MKKVLGVLLFFVLTFGMAGMAGAELITSANIPDGSSNVNLGFATVTSSPRAMVNKTLGSYTGFGVAGGFVPGEIDLADTEMIVISFIQPQFIDYIDLGFLFSTGNYGDVVSEIAGVVAQVGNIQVGGELEAQSDTVGIWSVGSTSVQATMLSPGNDSGSNAGIWRVYSPFGGLVSSLTFYAVYDDNGPINSANSDYSIVAVKTPEPLSMILTGLGLLGLAALRRKD